MKTFFTALLIAFVIILILLALYLGFYKSGMIPGTESNNHDTTAIVDHGPTPVDPDLKPVSQEEEVRVHVKYLESNSDFSNKVDVALSKLFTELNNAFANKSIPNVSGINISSNAQNQLFSLWNSNKFKMLGLQCTDAIAVKVFQRSDYIVLGIPIIEKDKKDIKEYFIQFNSSATIISIEKNPFPIIRYTTGKREVTEEQKNQIIMLLKHLKDAYNSEDMAYLEEVFLHKGLSIVGKEVKPNELSINREFRLVYDNKQYTLTIERIEQYLENLKNVFKYNEKVIYQYGEPEVTAHINSNKDYDGIYYVTVKQDFESDNYEDHGYLTLGIDLKDARNPKILFRCWLPNKVPTDQYISLF